MDLVSGPGEGAASIALLRALKAGDLLAWGAGEPELRHFDEESR